MAADHVVDASVLGAAFYNEAHSDAARAFLAAEPSLAAPDLIFAQIASLSAKKVWRDEASLEVAARALRAVSEFVSEFEPLAPLSADALDLCARLRLSAYDAFYVALAVKRDLPLITLDARLIARAKEAGLECRLATP